MSHARTTERTLIVSDLHLGPGGSYDIFAGADALPALLDALGDRPTQVVINGDGLDFLLDDRPIERLDVEQARGQAQAIVDHHRPVFEALRRVRARGGEVVFRLGNHDPELALPEVQAVLTAASGPLRFHRGDRPDVIQMGHARILVTHGEHDDPANRVAWRHLPGDESDASGLRFRHPSGSRLVKHALNPLKRAGHRFADLVKPDIAGGALAVALLGGDDTARVLHEAGLDVGRALAWARLSHRRTFTGDEEAAALARAAERGGEARPGEPGWFARVLARGAAGVAGSSQVQRHASAASEAFFDLAPDPREWQECRRLQSIFRVGAVIMGHTHAARFGRTDGLVHANTGTWIPRVRLPAADDIEAWDRFVRELRADPMLTGVAAHRLETRFTATLIEATSDSAMVSLVEWTAAGLRVVEDGGTLCEAEVPRVPMHPPIGRAGQRIRPLMVGADGRRFAPDGFDPGQGPTPESRARSLGDTPLASAGGDKHDLALQRWGVVVPAGEERRFRALLAPLIALRAREMESVPPFLAWRESAGEEADEWVQQRWLEGFAERERPAYVMIVGDFTAIPHRVGQALVEAGAYVGRLAFEDDDDYRSYAEKVARWHGFGSASAGPHMGIFAALDGSEAMAVAQVSLIDPLAAALRAPDDFERVDALDERCWSGSATDLFGEPLVMGPNLLFTVGHGIGPPRGGWADHETQRRLQGALSLGGDTLEAVDLARGRFLPGGIWFSLACFSAGTPSESDFAHWLPELEAGAEAEAHSVLLGLSSIPFVARAPMAALANPNGPLAFVGHVDLAWTHAFDHPLYRGQKPHEHFVAFARELGRAEGRHGRVGFAAWRLWHGAQRFEGSIARALDRAKRNGQPPPPAGAHWLARHDLASYVVLGDPAVTLPGRVPRMAWGSVDASDAVEVSGVHLTRSELADVIELAVELDLVAPEKRSLLMEGIDRRVWRAIAVVADPIGQLREDLKALNAYPAVALLAVWIENAARLASPRVEGRDLDALARRLLEGGSS